MRLCAYFNYAKIHGLIWFQLIIFQSDPIDSSWTGQGHFRFDPGMMTLSQSVTSICLDFLVLSLPLPVLAILQMPTHRKIAIGMILWLGALYDY
jgi:hypothetical protein